MVTVHMIGNAHLDPVWLWRKCDGVDTALATARSACDRLDEYAPFVFTCSASWFHETVERIDPELFERIRRFVQAGRWQIVGGMVIQPDCNLPSAESFARQLAVGQGYFRDRFGRAATVGYNVDSFGHTAYLPGMLRAAGIDSYCFMRPGPQEKKLPARLFRWRSPDGQEVTAFRIKDPYCTWFDDMTDHVRECLSDLPAGIEQTMCFYGVGDHGGGPTKRQIEWIAAHADAVEGARVVFSHPRAFFDAVAPHRDALPVVADELQHHAVGCYSVERRIKLAMRRAEAALAQAAAAMEALPGHVRDEERACIEKAWRGVLFNQFHDILGGTCIDASSRRAAGEMLGAEAAADGVLTAVTRRAFRDRAVPTEHRVALFNASDAPFDGWVEHEPWGMPQEPVLSDPAGGPVPCQIVPSASMTGVRRIVFRQALAPREQRVLVLTGRAGQAGGAAAQPAPAPAAGAAELKASSIVLSNARVKATMLADGVELGDWTLRLNVHDDPTDTWSHSAVNRFRGARLGGMSWSAEAEPVETGPLRAALRFAGRYDVSRVWARVMLCAGEPMFRVRLRVVWGQVRQMLRLRLEGRALLDHRTDLVSGGPFRRPIDGLEYPLGGGLWVAGRDTALAVAAPEVLAAAVDELGVTLTLLRSPYAAHHDPTPADACPDQPVTDQGAHEFELAIWPRPDAQPGGLERLARAMRTPLVVWDLTG